jgi:hypothetical protein
LLRREHPCCIATEASERDLTASEVEKQQAHDWQAAIAARRYAVIVDEAHSSQSGETARELKAILGAVAIETGGDEPDWEDGLNQVMLSRGRQPNLSFFCVYRDADGQNPGAIRPDGPPRQAGPVSHLQHASGDRGKVHPRWPDQLHYLRHLITGNRSANS